MIKKLRIKFVCILMSVAAVLIDLIMGIVIDFAASSMVTQMYSMLSVIASSPYHQELLRDSVYNEELFPFFAVEVNNQGEPIVIYGQSSFLSQPELMNQIINTALDSEPEAGELMEYDLMYLKTDSPSGILITYGDVSIEYAMLVDLVCTCLLIFLAAMLVFLGVSILLSRWAVKPVEKAWDQQKQFVADASHELKTPLAVIMANAELMQQDSTPEKDKKKFSENILSMTYQMRSLVESLLEMARVDNGTINTNFTALNLSQLVRDAVLSFQLLYEEKSMGLHHTISDGISIHGSEQHLYQVLDVLLDNALKYSTPGGTVGVGLTVSGRNCVLSVASPGEPISKDDLKNIFKRFYRVDKARAINGSYGLGLPLAESIVQAHKGKIWAESKEGLNTFYVQIPANTK